jgi:hypothetical protein
VAAAAAAGGTTTSNSRSRSRSRSSSGHAEGSINSIHSGDGDSGGITASARLSLSAQQAAAGGGSLHGKTLMVVESPTKAAKIQKFLGDDYKVMIAAAAAATVVA